MNRLLAVVGIAVVLGAAVVAGGWLWLQSRIQVPGPLTHETDVIIEPGSGLNRIATQLERTVVIESAQVFRWHARLAGFAGQLKAGEYRFKAATTPGDVLAKLVANDVVVRFIPSQKD